MRYIRRLAWTVIDGFYHTAFHEENLEDRQWYLLRGRKVVPIKLLFELGVL